MRRLLMLGLVAACVVVPLGQTGTTMPLDNRALRPRPAAPQAVRGRSLLSGRSRPKAFGHGALTPFRPSSSPRELLLSFDDGPDLKGTPLIMDELDRRGLKAIFFVTGRRLLGERPEDLARRGVLRRIVAHGHLIGNHTLDHINLCATPTARDRELDDNAEIIAAATGLRPLVFRSPYGAHCRALEAALADRDLVEVGWNLDPQEWQTRDGDVDILKYVTEKLQHLEGRGILLLHDTNPVTARVLPEILDWIGRENQRAAREGRPPIRIIDYTALLPGEAPERTGFEPIAIELAAQLSAVPAALGLR